MNAVEGLGLGLLAWTTVAFLTGPLIGRWLKRAQARACDDVMDVADATREPPAAGNAFSPVTPGAPSGPSAAPPPEPALTPAEHRQLQALASYDWPLTIREAGRYLADTLRRDFPNLDDLVLGRTALAIHHWTAATQARTMSCSSALAWIVDVSAVAALDLTELERTEVPR